MIKEAGFIVLVAIGLALSFNFWFAPNPIPLIKKEYTSEQTSDAEIDKLIAPTATPASTPAATPAATPASTPASTPAATPAATKPEVKEPPAEQSASAATKDLTMKQVEKLLNNPTVQFIDARTSDKYAQGHIGNAINIYGVEAQQRIPELLAIPQDRIVVVYCDGGEECELSHMVADILKNFGYQKVFIYKGGWEEWVKR
jgi:rhodanese-related sulfurtransferase